MSTFIILINIQKMSMHHHHVLLFVTNSCLNIFQPFRFDILVQVWSLESSGSFEGMCYKVQVSFYSMPVWKQEKTRIGLSTDDTFTALPLITFIPALIYPETCFCNQLCMPLISAKSLISVELTIIKIRPSLYSFNTFRLAVAFTDKAMEFWC